MMRTVLAGGGGSSVDHATNNAILGEAKVAWESEVKITDSAVNDM
jgi:hypothetical protein